MSQTHTEDRVATLHALLNDAAVRIGEQRLVIKELREALSELLGACIVEYGSPDEGKADEAVGWTADGKPLPFTFGHMQRARAALNKATGEA